MLSEVLLDVQRRLEALYALDPEPPVTDFLVERDAAAQPPGSRTLVEEEGDELLLLRDPEKVLLGVPGGAIGCKEGGEVLSLFGLGHGEMVLASPALPVKRGPFGPQRAVRRVRDEWPSDWWSDRVSVDTP